MDQPDEYVDGPDDRPLLGPALDAAAAVPLGAPGGTGGGTPPISDRALRHLVAFGSTLCGLGSMALLALGVAASMDKHMSDARWSNVFFILMTVLLALWVGVSTPYAALRLWDRLAKDERRAARLARDIELANAARRGFDIAQEAEAAKAASTPIN